MINNTPIEVVTIVLMFSFTLGFLYGDKLIGAFYNLFQFVKLRLKFYVRKRNYILTEGTLKNDK